MTESLGGPLALLGDSLIQNGDWSAWLPDQNVVNMGRGGQTTVDVRDRLHDVVAVNPETVALLIGTNDLAWRGSVETIVRNSETIVATLRRELPDTHLLVQSILPRGSEFAAQIRDINRHLWQFSPTVRAGWLDLWPTFATTEGDLNPDYTEDGLHLNTAGYQAWVSELIPALELARQLAL